MRHAGDAADALAPAFASTPALRPSRRRARSRRRPPLQVSAASGTLPPNRAATFFFGLMFGDRPRPTGAARGSHAGSAAPLAGSYGWSKNGSFDRAGSRPGARDDAA